MRYSLLYCALSSMRSRIRIDAPKKRFFIPFSTFMSLLFYGTRFPIREISLCKNATSLRCYRTDQLVGRNFLGCPFLLYLCKFQSAHVKGVVLIFSFKFSVLYNIIPGTEGKVLTYSSRFPFSVAKECELVILLSY